MRLRRDASDRLGLAYLKRKTTYEVLPGPGKLLRWSVPAGRGHDDLLISMAPTARLDEIDWRDRMTRGSGAG